MGLKEGGAEGWGEPVLPLSVGLLELTERITVELDSWHPDKEECLDLLCGLLVVEIGRAMVSVEEGRSPSLAERARQLLDSGFRNPLSIREVATRLHVSPDYLRQAFKTAYGEPPLTCLLRKRIEHATKLLRHSGMPVKNIAAEYGFNSPYYFSRVFKRLTGAPPSSRRRAPGRAPPLG